MSSKRGPTEQITSNNADSLESNDIQLVIPKRQRLDDNEKQMQIDSIDESTIHVTRDVMNPIADELTEPGEPYARNGMTSSLCPRTPKHRDVPLIVSKRDSKRVSGSSFTELFDKDISSKGLRSEEFVPRTSFSRKTSSPTTIRAMPLPQQDQAIRMESLASHDRVSSSATRTKHQKYIESSCEVEAVATQERKGILTPSKDRRRQPRKNVAFQVGLVPDLDLGFKDLPIQPMLKTIQSQHTEKPTSTKYMNSIDKTHKPAGDTGTDMDKFHLQTTPPASSHKPSKLKRPKKVLQSAKGLMQSPHESSKNIKNNIINRSPRIEEDIDDDLLCIICNNGHSEKPNEILICDGCEAGVHQDCYGIPFVPDDDWFCRDCKSAEIIETSGVDELYDVSSDSCLNKPFLVDFGIKNVEYHLQITQRLLLGKLTGKRRLRLKGLDHEYSKIHQIVEQTVSVGEGNSMLVIGSRGCGKSTLVEAVLEDISENHRQHFHIIRLSGFIHTDDKIAIKDIWRQLGKEMMVDDELTFKTSSASDTLASLLALLSHPSEIAEENSNQTANAVVFILDEFDLFTTHPRQTLLYNLFDIAQARKAPIAILGLTTKIDVVESLEKRVKSRFSHRYTHLPSPKNVANYWDICKSGLSVDLDEIVEHGFDPGLEGQEEFLDYWNTMLEDLYNNDTFFMQNLRACYYRIPSTLPLKGRSFVTNPTWSPPDSKLHILQSLAELDLAMLIAAARLDIILDADTCNFAMAYDEYSNLTAKHRIQASSSGVLAMGSSTKVWAKDVALGAWERLIDHELLIPAGIGGSVVVGGGMESRMWKVDLGLEEIPASVEGLSNTLSRWCREI